LFLCLTKHQTIKMYLLLLSLAPQPSLGLGLVHKIQLNFLEASQQFSFYWVGLLAPRPTPIPEDQSSVFISPRGRVATHFSRLLRHAWVTVGLFLFPGHHAGKLRCIHYFTPGVRASGTCWIGGWVGPRAILDTMVKRKIPSSRRQSNPRSPIVQPVV
jgi:hypothetical protein